MTLVNDLANVSCYSRNEGDEKEIDAAANIVYKNSHMYIPDFPRTGKSGVPSVLVFFVESMSALSFNRFMPKTAKASC